MKSYKRHSLGQHLLTSDEVANLLVDCASLKRTDSVYEIGTGTGRITELIAPRCEFILSCEIDPYLAKQAKARLRNVENVKIIVGNAFEPPASDTSFDVCVSSLPYARSLDFVEWIAPRSGSFRCAVVIVQSDFASKLCARPGDKAYRAVSVIAQSSFTVERLGKVDKTSFYPQPKVMSEVIRLIPRRDVKQPFFDEKRILLVKQLFSFRGRLLSSALRHMNVGADLLRRVPDYLLRNRIEKLTVKDFLVLIELLSKVNAF